MDGSRVGATGTCSRRGWYSAAFGPMRTVSPSDTTAAGSSRPGAGNPRTCSKTPSNLRLYTHAYMRAAQI